jgi:hypothetical protein
MTTHRTKITHDFSRWTALSALRSGAPIKSRAAIYPLLSIGRFAPVLEGETTIERKEFDAWHAETVRTLCESQPALCVGWAAKLVNVYLKTAVYLGGLGRPGLSESLHPPIDGGLWSGLAREFREVPEVFGRSHVATRIKDIRSYETYLTIIEGCREAARQRDCLLIEVEHL